MAESTDSIILEHLRHIRDKVDRIAEDVQDLKVRMTAREEDSARVRQDIAGLHESIAGVNRRLDRLDARVERIEKRLDLVEV